MDFSGLSAYSGNYSSYANAARANITAAQIGMAANGDDAELKNACLEFEAYFLNAMLKEMRKTTKGLSGEETSFARQTYQDMSDEALTRKLAEAGGIGLAAFMYNQMKAQNNGVVFAD